MKKPSLDWSYRIAAAVVKCIGSWRSIIAQFILIVAWIEYNILSSSAFDPYPFILLNLMLSFQAAFATPLILMSSNVADTIDRQRMKDIEANVDKLIKIVSRIDKKMTASGTKKIVDAILKAND